MQVAGFGGKISGFTSATALCCKAVAIAKLSECPLYPRCLTSALMEQIEVIV